MITNFKIFENNVWKKGDIVISLKNKYGAIGQKLKEGEKYQVMKVDKIKNKILVKSGDEKYPIYHYFPSHYFLSVKDWNIYQDSKKYNL